MSWWLWPTTADVGIRAFSSSPSLLIDEVIHGMQNIVLSNSHSKYDDNTIFGEIEWSYPIDRSLDRLMVRILEEVLYLSEVQNKWIVKSQTMMKDNIVHILFTYVDSNNIDRDVEVKAVTRHSLEFKQINENESIASIDGLPEMLGPGWFASVILDL
ncbi:MAG: archease [Candidatus Thermoplasmatota archaeon]|nr:archease [Candidatus Thermoplasmatota archaeon]